MDPIVHESRVAGTSAMPELPDGKPLGTANHPIYCAGDGSGGEHSRDPRIRRAAWAWVQLALPASASAFADGALAIPRRYRRAAVAGPRQTVNRAELTAFADCLEQTEGDVVYITDSSYVQLNFGKVLGKRYRKG